MNKSLLLVFLISLLYYSPIRAKEKTDSVPCIKKGNVTVSVGYGAPSIIRGFLKYNTKREKYKIVGYGPWMFKVDYMLLNRVSLGLNATYSFSRLSWIDGGYDTALNKIRDYEYGIEAEDISLTVRGNYHFYRKKNINAYAGLGAGYGRIRLGTYTEAPVNQFSVGFQVPRPYSLEGTVGMRYYIKKWLGLYGEFGIGKSWILFKKFIPESILQLGVNVKF